MYKVLILDESEVFCKSLMQLLPSEFETYYSQDGEKFAELLQRIRPDFLVLDLMVSGTDALYVLQAANYAGIRPNVLVITSFTSPYIEGLLQQMKVCYYVRRPVDMYQLAARVLDIAEDADFQMRPEETVPNNEKVESFLRYLGFLPHLKGYSMVVNAICIMMDNPRVSMTKELYPAVAEMAGTDWKHAEHSIRNCIKNAYKHRNDWIWRMYFPCGPDNKVGHLKNTVFLSTVASYLRQAPAELVMNL